MGSTTTNNNNNDSSSNQADEVSAPDMAEVRERLGDMNIPDDLLQSALVEAMRNGLDKLVGTSSGYLESLPASVRARIAYLEDVQNDYDAAEEALNEEIKGLERKYKPVFDKLLLLRKNVICGEEPVPDAFSVVADDIQDDDDDDDDEKEEEEEEDVVGIPDFWLVALCNHPMFDDMVTEKDAEILAFLEDVSSEDILNDTGDEEGYKLTFTFKENDFFSNKELSLVIELFQSGGMMQVDRLEGTEIQWKSDSVNPTIKVMKKKPKPGKGKKPAFKKEKVDSFFNVFSPPEPEELEDMDDDEAEEMQEVVEKILAMGETLREEIIPHAINWFTGEAAEEEDDEDSDEESDEGYSEGSDDDDDDDDDEGDDDDDDDDGEAPALKPVDAQNPECKQQ